MSLIVCPYCRGQKFNRHDKPEEITVEFWEKLAGPLNLCLLCKGHGKIGQEAFNAVGELGIVFLKTKTEPRKVLASCTTKGCRAWLDVTIFFSDRIHAREGISAQCSAGHAMVLELIP